jgi:transposase
MEKGVLPLIYIRRGRNAKERQHYTPEEKVAILRRHLLDKVPVSDLCEELGLQPTVFYRWQKEFFENGAAALQSKERPARQVEEKQKRIEFLEKKVQTKDEVLAELMAEHITKKKSWGALTKAWVPHDVRDQVVDFVRRWSEKTEIGAVTTGTWNHKGEEACRRFARRTEIGLTA